MWRSCFIGLSMLVIYLMATMRYMVPLVHHQLTSAHTSETLCISRDKPRRQCHIKCQLRKEIRQLHSRQLQKELLQHLLQAFQPVEGMPHLLAALPHPWAAAAATPAAVYTLRERRRELPVPFRPPKS